MDKNSGLNNENMNENIIGRDTDSKIPPEEYFNRADKLYAEGDFAGAANLWRISADM